jgi:hypothetical protein
VLLTSAGQALGDAGAFLAAQPWMLLFMPWLMLNCQAMTLVPVVLVPKRLDDARPRAWLPRYAAPLLGIAILYAIVAAPSCTSVGQSGGCLREARKKNGAIARPVSLGT